MTNRPVFLFLKGHQPPEDPNFIVPPVLDKRAKELLRPGLYKIYLNAQDPRGREAIDILEFPDVKTPEDEIPLDPDDVLQLVLSPLFEHNEHEGRRIMYRTRWMYRGESDRDQKSVEFPLDTLEDEGPRQMELRRPGNIHAGAYMPGHDTDEAQLIRGQLAGIMQESRLMLQEQRHDVEGSRSFATRALDKMFDVVTGLLTHSENQARVNQTGWDALQRSIELRLEADALVAERQKKLDEMMNELARSGIHWDAKKKTWFMPRAVGDSSSKEKKDFLFNMLPMALEALSQGAQAMGQSKAAAALTAGGSMIKAMGDDGEDDDDDVIVEDEEPTATAGRPRPSGNPFMDLCRLFASTVTDEQMRKLQIVLEPHEYQMFADLRTAADPGSCRKALQGLRISLAPVHKRGPVQEILTSHQWGCLHDMGQELMRSIVPQQHPAPPASGQPSPTSRTPAPEPVLEEEPEPVEVEPEPSDELRAQLDAALAKISELQSRVEVAQEEAQEEAAQEPASPKVSKPRTPRKRPARSQSKKKAKT